MNTPSYETYQQSSQILLGFETLHPDKQLIPKVRFALETLTYKRQESWQVIDDFFMIIKSYKDFPVTPFLEAFAKARGSQELFEASLKLLNHLSYEPVFEDVRLIVNHLQLAEDSEGLRNLVIKFLNERGKVKELAFCKDLVSIALEEDGFTKTKKILNFYETLYQDEGLDFIEKGYEHFVNLNSPLQFFAFLDHQYKLPLMSGIRGLIYEGRERRFGQAFSKGQIKSKMWALDTIESLGLHKSLRSVLVLCGWYGILNRMMFDRWGSDGIERSRSVDVDPDCEAIADKINHPELVSSWKFKASTKDIFDLSYGSADQNYEVHLPLKNKKGEVWEEPAQYDIIINTSCEHIPNFKEWYDKIPDGQLLLLQSNDYFEHEEHCNCVNSTAEFREQTPMQNRLFSGALPLEKYTRYMVIGYK